MSEILAFVLVMWIVLSVCSSAKKKKNPARHAVNAPKAGAHQAQVSAKDNASNGAPIERNVSEEGESEADHRAHLMQSAPEGETEAEHAGHMQAADSAERGYAGEQEHRSETRPYFRDTADLRRAVIAKEILDAPLALRGLRK